MNFYQLRAGVAFVLLILFSPLCAQTSLDLQNFTGLKSEGELPPDFLRSWGDKYQESLQLQGTEAMKRKKASEMEEFWQRQHREIDMMLQSGQFSFGDPISVYLNQIADELLKDEPVLRDDIRIYLFKSPTVNAFAVADGIIGINVGLIAHVRSEAELAFVIAHEISHYVKEHQYDSFKKFRDLQDDWSMNPTRRFDQMVSRSKDHELEADEYGLKLYLKSSYHPKAVDTLFTTLHQGYITYGRKKVGTDFLAEDEFQVPEIFFRTEVDPISKEEDYFDQTHTHPNIATRRAAVNSALQAAPAEGKRFFVQSEDKFLQIRELARFEAVREKILYGQYGDALYDIYVLEDKHPNNRFLEVSRVRALYGLASFKAVDDISDVTGSNYHVEGPMQQVYHLIKQFNNKQLITTAFYHTLKAREKYPEVKVLKEFEKYLSRYMLAYAELEANDFDVETEGIVAFNKTVEDFPSERHYLRARQMHYRDFYRFLLKPQYESGWLSQIMEEHRAFKDSMDAEDYLSADEREDRREDREDRLEEYGSGLKIRNLILLDPTIMVTNASEDTKEQLEALEQEEAYKSMLPQWVKAAGIEPELLYVEEMSAGDIANYNVFSGLEEWIKQARVYRRHKITPVDLDISQRIKAPARYVCRILGYISQGEKDYYYFGVYDLQKGEVVYERSESVGRKLSMRDLEKETQTDLWRISN